MTLNETIIQTVAPIVSVCVPDLYIPEAGETPPEEYCTFNFDLAPLSPGDDAPHLRRALVQLHYFAPRRRQTMRQRRELLAALEGVEEFSAVAVENASDEDGQHYVFEFEAVSPDPLGGGADG